MCALIGLLLQGSKCRLDVIMSLYACLQCYMYVCMMYVCCIDGCMCEWMDGGEQIRV